LMESLAIYQDELSPELQKLWSSSGFKSDGTWTEVFGEGPGTDEVFMAWHFARYTNYVAEAGRSEYKLPLFVNAALIRPGYQPGRYPSAGPLPHLLDVWRTGAPKIDFLSPDIYFPNFVEWSRRYDVSGNPLFIPEASRGSRAAANAFYVFGQHDAIGLCPFAIDQLDDIGRQPLTHSYKLLQQLTPTIVAHQGKGTMAGVAPNVPFDQGEFPKQETLSLGGYQLTATFEAPQQPQSLPGLDPGQWLSGGLIINTAPDEFIVAGTSLIVTFAADEPDKQRAGLASVEKGRFDGLKWTTTQPLNGDETHQGRHVRIPPGEWGVQRVRLYRYR
jgi:beta-galactosidase GanA